MDKEKEIEGIAKIIDGINEPIEYDEDLCTVTYYPTSKDIAMRLHLQGYGNVKQAVKEFAEKNVKPLIDELVELLFNQEDGTCMLDGCNKPDNIQCGSSICIEENKQVWRAKLDRIIKELYGEEKNKEHEAFVEIAQKEVEKARKQTAKECLKILHSIGGCGATDEWSKGYDSAIDTAYDEISEKYGISDFEDDEDEDFEFETATNEECVEHQKQLQEMRKETAKEILQELFDEAMQYGKTTVGIEWMAKKYGVEVKE